MIFFSADFCSKNPKMEIVCIESVLITERIMMRETDPNGKKQTNKQNPKTEQPNKQINGDKLSVRERKKRKRKIEKKERKKEKERCGKNM